MAIKQVIVRTKITDFNLTSRKNNLIIVLVTDRLFKIKLYVC